MAGKHRKLTPAAVLGARPVCLTDGQLGFGFDPSPALNSCTCNPPFTLTCGHCAYCDQCQDCLRCAGPGCRCGCEEG